MKYQTIYIIFLMMCSGSIKAQTLCDDSEQVVFSCTIGKKTLSVCGSDDLDDKHGWMQYRFGTKEKMELVYPAQKVHPKKYFTSLNAHVAVDKISSTELRFSRGNTNYSVYSNEINFKHSAGVDIDINGRDIQLNCKGKILDDQFYDTINQLHLD